MASSCVCRVGGRTFGLYHPFRAATTVGSLVRQNHSSVARNVAGKRSTAVALSPRRSTGPHGVERVRWLTTTALDPPAPTSTTPSLDASSTTATTDTSSVPLDTPPEETSTHIAPVVQDPPKQGKHARRKAKSKQGQDKKQQPQKKQPPPSTRTIKPETNWIRVSNIPVITSLEDVTNAICNGIETGLLLLRPDDFLSKKPLSHQVEKEIIEPSKISDEEATVEIDASTIVLKEDNGVSLEETATVTSDMREVSPSLPPREEWIQSARLILSPHDRPTGYYICLKEMYLVRALLVLPTKRQPYCGGKELDVSPLKLNQHIAAPAKRNEASVRVEQCPMVTKTSHIRTLFGNYDVDYVEPIQIPSQRFKAFVVQFASPAHARAAVRNLQGSLKLSYLDAYNPNNKKNSNKPPVDPPVQPVGVILARFPQQMV